MTVTKHTSPLTLALGFIAVFGLMNSLFWKVLLAATLLVFCLGVLALVVVAYAVLCLAGYLCCVAVYRHMFPRPLQLRARAASAAREVWQVVAASAPPPLAIPVGPQGGPSPDLAAALGISTLPAGLFLDDCPTVPVSVLPAHYPQEGQAFASILAEAASPDQDACDDEKASAMFGFVPSYEPQMLLGYTPLRSKAKAQARRPRTSADEAVITVAACPAVAAQAEQGLATATATAAVALHVASPRRDARRPDKVGHTYKPYAGQELKPGQWLAVKEGAKYRRATTEEAGA